MGTNAKALVVATLHDDELNLVNDTAASVSPSGGSTHQEGHRRRGVLFDVAGADGVGDEVDFALGAFDVENITLACTFVPQQDMDTVTGSSDYYLIALGDGFESSEALSVKLDYDSGYNGFEVLLRNSAQLRLTIPGLEVPEGTPSHVALTLSHDTANSDHTLGVWLDGRLVRALEYTPADHLPTSADAVRVGNSFAGTPSRPAKSVIEDVLCYQATLDGDAIWSLATEGLKPACVDSPTIYESQKRVSGYARSATPGDVVVKWVDAETSRLWGFAKADTDILLFSDDNGATWNAFHDFNNGLVIRSVWTWDGKVYVSYNGSIDESDKTAAGFTQSLALAGPDSAVFSWGVAISPDGNSVFVAEYEPQPATSPNRILGISKSLPIWASAKALTGGEEHWHGVFFTRNGDLYATVGDAESRVYRSSNLGQSWETIVDDGAAPLSEEQVIQGVELTDGRILFASDATTSRALLGVYEPHGVGHAWDGVNRQWSRLGPVTGKLLANVFALYRSANGTVWIYANREGNAGRHSSIWVMDEDGRAPVLVEDLGEDTTITLGHNFVEHGGWIYLDAYRFPASVAVTTSQAADTDTALVETVQQLVAGLAGSAQLIASTVDSGEVKSGDTTLYQFEGLTRSWDIFDQNEDPLDIDGVPTRFIAHNKSSPDPVGTLFAIDSIGSGTMAPFAFNGATHTAQSYSGYYTIITNPDDDASRKVVAHGRLNIQAGAKEHV